ncbi:MAG TPA: hypothetical protein DDW50_18540 [Firmicutes bacterium]|nr:hypothetical protein [Bacillota bacterium]
MILFFKYSLPNRAAWVKSPQLDRKMDTGSVGPLSGRGCSMGVKSIFRECSKSDAYGITF